MIDDKQIARIRKRYTRSRMVGGRRVAFLSVGVQAFAVGPRGTKAQAAWFRTRLARALCGLLEDEKTS